MNWISAIHLGPHCVSQRLTRRQSVLNSTLPPPLKVLPPPTSPYLCFPPLLHACVDGLLQVGLVVPHGSQPLQEGGGRAQSEVKWSEAHSLGWTKGP